MHSDGSKTSYTAGIKVPTNMSEPNGTVIGIFTSDYVIGIVDRSVQLRVVSTYLAEIKAGKTGWSLAVNRGDGSVMGVSWSEPLMTTDSKGATRIKRVEELVAAGGSKRDVLSGDLATSATLAKAPRGLSSYKEHWVSIFDLQDENGMSWIIVVAIPESDFLSQIREAQRTNLLIVAGMFVFVVLLGVLLTYVAVVKTFARS